MTSAELGELPLARASHDLAAAVRGDEEWLAKAWQDPSTRVLLVAEGRTLVNESRDALVLVPPEHADGVERLLLGVVDGCAYFAAMVGELPTRLPVACTAAGLREVGPVLDARDAGLLVHAVALATWHAGHPHCARCGARTEIAQAGQSRRCPSCSALHFPRSDPAVIMLVTDATDRCLLGRGPSWLPGRFSTLAGFVEPGETPERAVVREVAEEVGVRVGAVRYVGSQPWPFPSSLMLGYLATALTTDIQVDGAEISEARWFTRDEVRAGVASGALGLSGRVSIARALIESWYGAELPEPAASAQLS